MEPTSPWLEAWPCRDVSAPSWRGRSSNQRECLETVADATAYLMMKDLPSMGREWVEGRSNWPGGTSRLDYSTSKPRNSRMAYAKAAPDIRQRLSGFPAL